jgi:tetratricopeptide (TPR) repeat protein
MYYYQLGRVQATMKNYSDARTSFASSIKYNDKYASSQYNFGYVLERLNRTNEALVAYRKACSIDTNYEKAYLAAARLLVRTGNYSEAVSEYKEAVRINPSNANTYKEQGSAYASNGNYKEAEGCYRKALALLKPGEDDPATYYNLSTVMFNQGKTDDAVTYAKKAYDTKDSAQKEVQVNSVYNYALMCDKTCLHSRFPSYRSPP